jgi:hypothetical protein
MLINNPPWVAVVGTRNHTDMVRATPVGSWER